ncbi:hypothetical protein VNO77_27020 [Canavalia gladiata]|uniref:Uncharacterized protein n=1 Tax=Canavalia gladiata TaxID=3824 RepID=A0AAN9KY37_CANGL
MGGGAWPFLVGGAICLVNSVNERDLSLLNSCVEIIAIVGLQRGISSKHESSARVDYVPALCTHRPSLLPIEWSGEVFGWRRRGRFAARDVDHCRCLTISLTCECVSSLGMTKMLIILTSLGLEVGYAMHGFLPAKLKPQRNMRQGT